MVDTRAFREKREQEIGNEDFQSLVAEVEEGFLFAGENQNVFDERLVADFCFTHLINVGSQEVEEGDRKEIKKACRGSEIEHVSITIRTSTQEEFVEELLKCVLLLDRLQREGKRVLLFSSKEDINFSTTSDPVSAISLAFLMQSKGWTVSIRLFLFLF